MFRSSTHLGKHCHLLIVVVYEELDGTVGWTTWTRGLLHTHAVPALTLYWVTDSDKDPLPAL
jgi:hypothetical protein